MIESILGMIVGAGLFIGGFHLHDVNYRPDDRESNTIVTNGDGKKYLVNGRLFNNPERKREFKGYVMGVAGAAIFALSAKHAWDQCKKRQDAVSMHLNHTFQRLRTRLENGQAAQGAWKRGATFRLRPPPGAAKVTPFTSLPAIDGSSVEGHDATIQVIKYGE